MKKSKPLAALRKRLGINSPGMAIAVVAILISLTGGAFAASGGLTASQKKQVKSIAQTEAKKFAGKPGSPGAQGPQGQAGSAGPKGDKGDQGLQGLEGEEGEEGEAGEEGEGVVLTPIPKGQASTCEEQGEEGGVEVRLKKQTAGQGEEVCNGAEGAAGPKGEPWTAGGILPPGATETGSWAFNGTTADTEGIRTAISFAIPFEYILKPEHVHFGQAEEEGFADFCPSASPFNPRAEPGELCVYINNSFGLVNATFDGIFSYTSEAEGAARGGALLKFTPTGVAFGAGSFAVTGCTLNEPTAKFPCPPEP